MATKGDTAPEKLGNFGDWSSRNEIQIPKPSIFKLRPEVLL